MKKRILSILISALLVFGMLPAAALAEDTTPSNGYNDNDEAQIKAFLAQDSAAAGQTNAQALGYDINDPQTWDDVFWTDEAEDRVQNIDWHNKGLAGDLSLSGLTSLASLNVGNNQITSFSFDGSGSLSSLDCSDNSLETINAVIEGGTVELGVTGSGIISRLDYDSTFISMEADAEGLSVFAGWSGTDEGTPYTSSEKSIELTPGHNYDLIADFDDVTLNTDDIGKIQDFLEQPSAVSGQTNAQVLGYDIDDPTTWTDVEWELSGTEASAASINWSDENIAGVLDISGCEAFVYLNVSGTEVTEVYSNDCALIDLVVTGCGDLEVLECSENELESLDLEGCTSLAYIECYLNSVESLDVTDCPITYLNCGGNKIAVLKATIAGGDITLRAAGLGYVELFYSESTGTLRANALDNGSASGFVEWISGGGSSYSSDEIIDLAPGNDFNLTAAFGYTVLFDFNGYMAGGTVPPFEVYDEGDLVTVPGNTGNLVRTGYTFAGWNEESDGTGTQRNAGTTFTMPGNDVWLFAQWDPIDYYITYNANGATTGAAPAGTGPHHFGDVFQTQVNSGNLQKMNYMFAGWNTEPDGSGTHYGAPGPITMPAQNLILYAEWEDGYYNADVAKIKAFLVQNSHVAGETNAEMLGLNPNGTPSSWDNLEWYTGSDGLKHIREIYWWNDCELAGTLDLSGCSYLTEVDCSMNYLTSLNISGCTSLETLDCSGNLLTTLAVGNLSQLETLYCSENKLTTLTIGNVPKLEDLYCSENKLTSLNTSGASKLGTLFCSHNKIASLVLNAADTITTLDCSFNTLSSVNIAGRSKLEEFACMENKINSLNLTGCKELYYLVCTDNNISSLNLSGCVNLIVLDCGGNSLTSLNTSACPDLAGLDCSNNRISSLNLSSNKELQALYCSGNRLMSLSLSQKFYYFECLGNPMTSLSVTLLKEDDTSMPITLKASGQGYVGLVYMVYDEMFEIGIPPTVMATPAASHTFIKWTKSGKTASTKPSFEIKSSGTYTAEFAYKQGVYLSGVTISAGKMSPTFSKTKTSYKITLPENQSSVTITPVKITNVLAMTINGKSVSNYTVNLANGKSTTVKVKVSYGKSSKTYTFKVSRAKSTNNNLATLAASAGTFDSAFNPSDTSYILTLDENVKSTKITATAAAGKLAKISPSSTTVSLKNGGYKTVKIKVKSQAGKYKTYTIKVVRKPSTNNNLSYLKTSSKSMPLSPSFSAGTTNYTITLPVDKSTVTISAKAAGYKATVYINGKKASSKKITLKAGANTTVYVKVKAQSGAEKVYTITVNRLISTDANLKSLKTSSKTAPLSPAFSPGVTSYNVTLPAKSGSVTLYASANGYGAKVTIDGKSASSKKITLKNGESKTVRIVVKSQAGNTKEFVITVTRPFA